MNRSLLALALVGLIGVALPASAQPAPSPISEGFIRAFGAMYTVAQICGHYTESELVEIQEGQQRRAWAAWTIPEATFTRAYAQGAADARAQWETLTPDQRAVSCVQHDPEDEGNAP